MTPCLDDLTRLKIKSDVYDVAPPVADRTVRNLLGVNPAPISGIAMARPHVDGAEEWPTFGRLICFTGAKGLGAPGGRNPVVASVFLDWSWGRQHQLGFEFRYLLFAWRNVGSVLTKCFLLLVAVTATIQEQCCDEDAYTFS